MLIRDWLNSVLQKNLKTKESIGLKDTKQLYTNKNGVYNSNRKKLHQRITADLLKISQDQNTHPPSAYFFGGGSCSGKTTLKEKMKKELPQLKYRQLVHVDPDEIKKHLPEYEIYKQKNPQEAAILVHKESCDIRDELVELLIRKKIHFIYESTMAKPQKYKYLFSRLREEGFNIHLYIADVPLSLAIDRAAKRAKQDNRVVPEKVIINTHKLVPKTFQLVKELTDSCHLYDTQKDTKVILSCKVENHNLYQNFLKRIPKD